MKELFSPNEGQRVVREGQWLLMKCTGYLNAGKIAWCHSYCILVTSVPVSEEQMNKC